MSDGPKWSRDASAVAKVGYHRFLDAYLNEEQGSFEVFYDDGCQEPYPEPGWYWHPCFPGCLSDGEPVGPFDTSTEAWEDAQS
jgi:hypothetical protein